MLLVLYIQSFVVAIAGSKTEVTMVQGVRSKDATRKTTFSQVAYFVRFSRLFQALHELLTFTPEFLQRMSHRLDR